MWRVINISVVMGGGWVAINLKLQEFLFIKNIDYTRILPHKPQQSTIIFYKILMVADGPLRQNVHCARNQSAGHLRYVGHFDSGHFRAVWLATPKMHSRGLIWTGKIPLLAWQATQMCALVRTLCTSCMFALMLRTFL